MTVIARINNNMEIYHGATYNQLATLIPLIYNPNVHNLYKDELSVFMCIGNIGLCIGIKPEQMSAIMIIVYNLPMHRRLTAPTVSAATAPAPATVSAATATVSAATVSAATATVSAPTIAGTFVDLASLADLALARERSAVSVATRKRHLPESENPPAKKNKFQQVSAYWQDDIYLIVKYEDKFYLHISPIAKNPFQGEPPGVKTVQFMVEYYAKGRVRCDRRRFISEDTFMEIVHGDQSWCNTGSLEKMQQALAQARIEGTDQWINKSKRATVQVIRRVQIGSGYVYFAKYNGVIWLSPRQVINSGRRSYIHYMKYPVTEFQLVNPSTVVGMVTSEVFRKMVHEDYNMNQHAQMVLDTLNSIEAEQ